MMADWKPADWLPQAFLTAMLAASFGYYLAGGYKPKKPDLSDCRYKSSAAPWQESSKKGENSYYYGHHTRANDGLAASDYTMNGPRRLDPATKKPVDSEEAARKAREAAVNAPRAPVARAPAPAGKPACRGVILFKAGPSLDACRGMTINVTSVTRVEPLHHSPRCAASRATAGRTRPSR